MNLFIKIGNSLNKTILRSPLHPIMSKTTLLITFTGQKSGKPYTIPVNFSQTENQLVITSEKQRNWWRNLKTEPAVKVLLRGIEYAGHAVVLKNPEEVAEKLAIYLKSIPQAAQYFKIRLDANDIPLQDDLMIAASSRVIIQIHME